jgi:hypothetical protein
MAYIPDLSPYNYTRHLEYGPILAVGWLDPAVPYPQGEVPIDFLAKLHAWSKKGLNYLGSFRPLEGIVKVNQAACRHAPTKPIH